MSDYDDLFTRAALHALPTSGEGLWVTSKIVMEGKDWNWKEMKKRMKEAQELNLEQTPKGLYVPKGNPTRLDYGRFRPSRVNRLGDADNGSEYSDLVCHPCEEGSDNNFDIDIGRVTTEEFGQFIGQRHAVRKGGCKGIKG